MSRHRTLGINGLGRIGKLTLWYEAARDHFDRMVVNLGREVGQSLESIAEYISKDSTYGPLHRYIDGYRGQRDIQVIDEATGLIRIHGKEVQFLTSNRNPVAIPWREHGVSVVVDCTGVFVDPHAPADAPKGSLRGHLEAGAKVVMQSSAFKSKSKAEFPADSVTLIHGINQHLFDPAQHTMVAAASCTTTALAHMLKPLLDQDVTRNIMTAGMSTVHAATNSQSVLDSVPGAGSKDLRKVRSALNNVILTSTNAARALEQVMPEISKIGFMADSVRIPTPTVSLIILNVTFQTELLAGNTPAIDRSVINRIYQEAGENESRGLLKFTTEQNVSQDLVGEDAAVIIEGADTHTRTGFIDVKLPEDKSVHIPVTHVKIFGWYDNELGSYTNRMGELTQHIAYNL